MGMGKGVKPGLGHGGIICVLQTQFSFFFFLGGGGGGVGGSRGTGLLLCGNIGK